MELRPIRSLQERVAYENSPFVKVRHDLVELPDGRQSPHTVGTSGTGSGLAVLALLDQEVLMVIQNRHAPQVWPWEIPRRFCQEGVDLDVQAKELLDREAACDLASFGAESFIDLGRMTPDSGWIANRDRLLATRLPAGTVPKARRPFCVAKLFPVAYVLAVFDAGLIEDSYSGFALMKAFSRGLLPPSVIAEARNHSIEQLREVFALPA